MEKISKYFWIAGGTVVLIILLLVLMFHFVPSPPASDVEYARKAISKALRDNADKYSEEDFSIAVAYYDSAMLHWKSENERFIYSRNYDKVAKYAESSAQKAIQASDNSVIEASNLKIKLNQRMNTLNSLVNDLSGRFDDYPLSADVRNSISRGKFLLIESGLDFQNGDYNKAESKLSESEYLLTGSYEHANENLKSYFRSFPEWRRWIDSTIVNSRKTGDYSIIVDKFSRKVFIYLNGTKQYEYSAELGKNWVGDKRVRGDKATPEGMYKIVRKFLSDSTKYYKALLIDYPNDEDTAKFLAAKAKGNLPLSANIGGLIEIHGDGGRGADWTEGCIALKNREMDIIFNIAKVGTPVTIVGSMYDLRQVLNR